MKRDITKRLECCAACQTYRSKKVQSKPQFPIDTMEFSPGECFQVDLYELDKTDYITVFDKATGLVNKETRTTIRALENICLKEIDKFAEKNNNEVIRCSPYHHQGNGQAEQTVNTLKTMIKRDRKSKVERLFHDLNSMRRIGFKALPMAMFFNRPV